MKTLLAILLSFIMTEAPVLAIHGGYTLGSATNLVGTYAGVLVPTSDVVFPSTATGVSTSGTTVTDFGANALGLFTLSVPQTGFGSGAVTIFSSGRTFSGTIQALPDPNAVGGITGILNANFNYSLYVPVSGSNGNTITTISVTASAQGPFNAVAVSDDTSPGGLGINLTGTTSIQVNQGFVDNNGVPLISEQITFAVDGFQQSTTASTTTTTGT